MSQKPVLNELITDPWIYRDQLKVLGEAYDNTTQYDRVFKINYIKRIIPSLCDQVVYKPCRITVLNNGKGVEATLLPILTSELEYLLNMNIDRYYSASYEKSTKTIFWTNRTSGDALMLSPEQYKKIDSQPWDVKGLGRKTLAVGSEYWIPNLLSYDGDENIKLMKWRSDCVGDFSRHWSDYHHWYLLWFFCQLIVMTFEILQNLCRHFKKTFPLIFV